MADEKEQKKPKAAGGEGKPGKGGGGDGKAKGKGGDRGAKSAAPATESGRDIS